MGVRSGHKAQRQQMGVCKAMMRDNREVQGSMGMVCRQGRFRANEWKMVRDGHCSLSEQAGSEGGSWEETKRQEDLIVVEMVDSWEWA